MNYHRSFLFFLILACAFVHAIGINFKQYKSCSSCTAAGWGWCSIQKICGGFANKRCPPGDDFSVGYKSRSGGKKKLVSTPKPSGGGTDMSSTFKELKTCKDCLAAGYGWCPIRRMCGGFANQQCSGDSRDFRSDYTPPKMASIELGVSSDATFEDDDEEDTYDYDADLADSNEGES
jgi:hypothetical protein